MEYTREEIEAELAKPVPEPGAPQAVDPADHAAPRARRLHEMLAQVYSEHATT